MPHGGSSVFGSEVYDDPADHPGFQDHPNHVWMWNDLDRAIAVVLQRSAEEAPRQFLGVRAHSCPSRYADSWLCPTPIQLPPCYRCSKVLCRNIPGH